MKLLLALTLSLQCLDLLELLPPDFFLEFLDPLVRGLIDPEDFVVDRVLNLQESGSAVDVHERQDQHYESYRSYLQELAYVLLRHVFLSILSILKILH